MVSVSQFAYHSLKGGGIITQYFTYLSALLLRY
jgi:hypothetical protein